MKLAYKVANIESVPEAFRSLYTKNSDGSYTLEVEGVVENDKLKEFRDKNIELLKEAEKYKDLNPEKYKELMELQRQRQEKELIDKGEVDQVIMSRVKAMKEEFETTAAAKDSTINQMTRQLESLLIDNTVRMAATKTGVRAEAVDDMLLRAKTVFSIKDGKVAATDSEGKIVYGKDGTTPLGIEEWSAGLKVVAPHLYMGSNGGGATGNVGGAGNSGNKSTPVGKIAGALNENNYD